MKQLARARLTVSGRVQGVFFRMETVAAAERIGGLGGWVRNRRDGTVEAVVEGERERVSRLIEWCREGPPRAHVSEVAVDWQSPTEEFTGFEIKY